MEIWLFLRVLLRNFRSQKGFSRPLSWQKRSSLKLMGRRKWRKFSNSSKRKMWRSPMGLTLQNLTLTLNSKISNSKKLSSTSLVSLVTLQPKMRNLTKLRKISKCWTSFSKLAQIWHLNRNKLKFLTSAKALLGPGTSKKGAMILITNSHTRQYLTKTFLNYTKTTKFKPNQGRFQPMTPRIMCSLLSKITKMN